MSSGLAPPAYHSDGATPNPLPADPWFSRPTSPTPTAGLGVGMGMGMNADNPRSERLRTAWGSIRERLGLRPSPPSPSPFPLGNNTSNAPSMFAANDPREVMMAEMARAFNHEFGMGGGEGSGSSPSETGGSDETEESMMPPEGSFERFLIDLQTDLRVALTNPVGLGADAGNTSEQQQQQPAPPASTSSDAFTQSHMDSPPPVVAIPIVDGTEDEHEHEDNMPELASVSDSDSEFEDAHEDEVDADMPPLASLDPPALGADSGPLPAVQGPSDNDNNGSGGNGTETVIPQTATGPADASPSNTQTGGTAPGRINWWRMYRFPPITAPRTHGTAGVTAATPPSGLSTLFTPPPPSPTSDPAPDPEMDPTLAELPFANADLLEEHAPQPPLHMVVPVIVVGLQSVNTASILQQQPGTTDDGDDSVDGEGEEDDAERDDGNSRQAEEHGRNTAAGRGRPWHTRAADAIRNLRPGRRHRAAPVAMLPGRTFLIYVIGGQYLALFFVLCMSY